jgi:hypothetical protein
VLFERNDLHGIYSTTTGGWDFGLLIKGLIQAGIRCCIPWTQKQDAVEIGQAAGFIDQGKVVLQNAFAILEADLSADSDVLTA